MRLLITTDTVGGVWSFTRDLSTELLHRGHVIALLSFGRAPSPEQQAWAAAQGASYPQAFFYTASDLPLEWMQTNEQILADAEPVVAAIAEQFHPDLLLSNQFCFGAVNLRLPRVIVAHSDVLSWAKAAKPTALEPTPWVNRYTSLVQRGLMQADVLITPTRWLLGEIKQNFFLSCSTAVIPNGCAAPATAGVRSKTLQAITAGRLWDEAKGLDVLSELNSPLPILVAGETSFEAAQAPLPPQLRLVGPQHQQQLQDLFQQSALYVCTSTYEPFGLAPVEAALCGCAVVARDLPSLREVWGDAALFFRDAAHLRDLLQRLVTQPEFLAEAQRRSTARASQYTVARMADAYLHILSVVLQRKAGQHVA